MDRDPTLPWPDYPKDPEPNITPEAVYAEIRRVLQYPGSQVCVHYVAAHLLNMMERCGVEISKELAHAVVFAEDEAALALLPPG